MGKGVPDEAAFIATETFFLLYMIIAMLIYFILAFFFLSLHIVAVKRKRWAIRYILRVQRLKRDIYKGMQPIAALR